MITAISWPRKMLLRRTLRRSTFNFRRLMVIYQPNISLLFYVAHCVMCSATWKRRSSFFSAMKYSLKCIHCMYYKCRWKLKLKLNLICLMQCVRPICRFARVVGVQNSIGAGRLYSFRVIQIYICWHVTAIYGIWKLFRFFIEFLTQGLTGLSNETWSIIMIFPLTMALSFNFELLIS